MLTTGAQCWPSPTKPVVQAHFTAAGGGEQVACASQSPLLVAQVLAGVHRPCWHERSLAQLVHSAVEPHSSLVCEAKSTQALPLQQPAHFAGSQMALELVAAQADTTRHHTMPIARSRMAHWVTTGHGCCERAFSTRT